MALIKLPLLALEHETEGFFLEELVSLDHDLLEVVEIVHPHQLLHNFPMVLIVAGILACFDELLLVYAQLLQHFLHEHIDHLIEHLVNLLLLLQHVGIALVLLSKVDAVLLDEGLNWGLPLRTLVELVNGVEDKILDS